MRKMWNNLKMDAATDGGAAGGSSGGATSLLNTNGGTPPAKADGTGTPPGDAGKSDASTNNASKGDAATDWRSSLPKELQEDATIKKFTSVHALAGAYVNAQKLIGGDKIAVPGKHTTEDDWKEIHKKLGLPEKIEDYGIKFKEGVSVDEQFATSFKQQAHAAGVLPKQAQALAEWFSDRIMANQVNQSEKIKQQFEANVNTLKKDWGNAYELNVNRANKAIMDLGGKEMVEYVNKSGMGSDPAFLKFLAKVGETVFTEHKFVDGQGGAGTMGPKELEAEIKKIQANPAYFDKMHPQHKVLVEEAKGLYEKRYNSN